MEAELLPRLPPFGMTAGGRLYEQATPEHLIAVRDGSALPNLPTPTSQAAKHGATPDIHANGYGSNLWDLPHLLPTPVVNDMGRGKTPEEWDSWTDEMKERHGNGNRHGPSLAIEAARLLPTPTVQDGANNAGPSQWERNSDPLNVVAVKLTMGLTGALSNDGNGSSDDEHPPLPIAEDCDPSSSSG